jgi:hypothetical protein
MINWTEEAVRAEADYRREQLRKLAGRRRSATERGGARHRWLPRALRR